MHELSLCTSVVRVIEQQAAKTHFRRVKTVRLEVGALSNVETDAMRFGFAAAARGTIAEGAELEIVCTPAHGWCPQCAIEVIVSSRIADCPSCGAAVMGIRGGDALTIKNLEVE